MPSSLCTSVGPSQSHAIYCDGKKFSVTVTQLLPLAPLKQLSKMKILFLPVQSFNVLALFQVYKVFRCGELEYVLASINTPYFVYMCVWVLLVGVYFTKANMYDTQNKFMKGTQRIESPEQPRSGWLVGKELGKVLWKSTRCNSMRHIQKMRPHSNSFPLSLNSIKCVSEPKLKDERAQD